MNRIQSISTHEAYTRSCEGLALLICAYESNDKFRNVRLQGAVSLNSFKGDIGSIPVDRELIFY